MTLIKNLITALIITIIKADKILKPKFAAALKK